MLEQSSQQECEKPFPPSFISSADSSLFDSLSSTDNPIGLSSEGKCEKPFPSDNTFTADNLIKQSSKGKGEKPTLSDNSSMADSPIG